MHIRLPLAPGETMRLAIRRRLVAFVSWITVFLAIPIEISTAQVAEIAKLSASNGQSDSYFGFAVSLWGDRALIGTPRWDGYYDRSGSAYIFERQKDGSWQQTAELKAS